MHWVNRHERRCPLFTIDDRIPKLDVADSIPVSRSMFSKAWGSLALHSKVLNGVTSRTNTLNRAETGGFVHHYELAFTGEVLSQIKSDANTTAVSANKTSKQRVGGIIRSDINCRNAH